MHQPGAITKADNNKPAAAIQVPKTGESTMPDTKSAAEHTGDTESIESRAIRTATHLTERRTSSSRGLEAMLRDSVMAIVEHVYADAPFDQHEQAVALRDRWLIAEQASDIASLKAIARDSRRLIASPEFRAFNPSGATGAPSVVAAHSRPDIGAFGTLR